MTAFQPDFETIDLARLGLPDGTAEMVDHLGRRCLRFADDFLTPSVAGLELTDGVIEADMIVPRARSFHGLMWRVRGDDYESFFVRPHQVGNPDAIQYTPVSNDISSWQLYHGPGFWSPITFPIDRWFTMRVAFSGDRADMYVDDLQTPVLATRLRHPSRSGGAGLLVGGPGLHLSRLAASRGPVDLVGTPPPDEPRHPGVIRSWDVSDPFPEALVTDVTHLSAALVADRSWTSLAAETGGLADLAFVNGVRDGRDTVLARTTVHAPEARTRRLDLGFSDRAIVFLNGRALFRGDDSYRSRDYRFLGSIGYWYTVHLPLEAGDNELVVAVSESFGGWGVQARFADEV